MLIMLALFMPVLFGAVGLAIDVGNLYLQRRSMQSAADLAARSAVVRPAG